MDEPAERDLRLRESIPPPPDDARTEDDPDAPDEEPLAGIRCPLCAWQPRPSDRWSCRCGMSWNTFATRGRCPRCERQWRETQCLACQGWALHLDWYEAPARRD